MCILMKNLVLGLWNSFIILKLNILIVYSYVIENINEKRGNMLFFKKFFYNVLKVINYIIYIIIYVYIWLKFGYKFKKMYCVLQIFCFVKF